jgi:hypothetical protein
VVRYLHDRLADLPVMVAEPPRGRFETPLLKHAAAGACRQIHNMQTCCSGKGIGVTVG